MLLILIVGWLGGVNYRLASIILNIGSIIECALLFLLERIR